MERVIGLVLALLLTLGGLLAESMRTRFWQAYVDFRSPYLVQLPAGDGGESHTRRVVLIIVRGLTAREAEAMPAMVALRERGASATLQLSPPSYETPAWLTMLSGASTEVHGGMTDAASASAALDTLFHRVSGATGVGVLLATEQINKRFTSGPQLADVFEDTDRASHDAGIAAAMAQNLRMPNAPERLLVGELSLLEASRTPDDAAARAMAVAAVDIRLESIAGTVDRTKDTLIVVADRGRAPDGREGGDELDVTQLPLVMAGAGVRPGAQTLGNMTDLAPTIAALLGIPIPVHAQGVPLWDLIYANSYLVSARQLTTFYETWAELVGHARFAAELLQPFEADLGAGARPRFEVWHAMLLQEVEDARGTVLAREQAARLPFVLLLAAAIAVAVYFVLDQNAQPPLIGAGIFFGVLAFDAIFNLELRPSLSLFNQSGASATLDTLVRHATLAYLAVGVIVAIVSALTCETYGEALVATMGALTIIAAAGAGVALWFYLRWGDSYSLFLPDHASLAATQIALHILSALNVTLLEGLPALPAPLILLLPSLLAWNLFGGRFIRA